MLNLHVDEGGAETDASVEMVGIVDVKCGKRNLMNFPEVRFNVAPGIAHLALHAHVTAVCVVAPVMALAKLREVFCFAGGGLA